MKGQIKNFKANSLATAALLNLNKSSQKQSME